MLATTTDGHTIEIKPGSYYGPECVVQMHAGVKRWLLIDGATWYWQDFRNGPLLNEAVESADLLTFAEWLEYCGNDVGQQAIDNAKH